MNTNSADQEEVMSKKNGSLLIPFTNLISPSMSTNSADQEEVMSKKNGSLLTPTVRREQSRSGKANLFDDEAKSHHIHPVKINMVAHTDEMSRNNLHSERGRGFLSRLKRSFTLGSTTSMRRSSSSSSHVTANNNSTTTSTPVEGGLEGNFLARLKRSLTVSGANGGLMRHRRSSPLGNTYSSTNSNGRSHGSDQFNTMRQREVLRSASQHVQKSTAALIKPLKKVRDSYVSCMIAVDSDPRFGSVSSLQGLSSSSSSQVLFNRPPMYPHSKEIHRNDLNRSYDLPTFHSDQQIREALYKSRHFNEAVPE